MKPCRLPLVLGLALALFIGTGCSHRLPNLKATEIHQTISFPGFSSTADASGIAVTDTTIRAADASWRVSVLGLTTVTTAKDFQQKREKEAPEAR
jgi:hypothetical protein